MIHTTKIEYNELTEEYYILLPKELLKDLKWKTGDNIKWSLRKDGSIMLKKI